MPILDDLPTAGVAQQERTRSETREPEVPFTREEPRERNAGYFEDVDSDVEAPNRD